MAGVAVFLNGSIFRFDSPNMFVHPACMHSLDDDDDDDDDDACSHHLMSIFLSPLTALLVVSRAS